MTKEEFEIQKGLGAIPKDVEYIPNGKLKFCLTCRGYTFHITYTVIYSNQLCANDYTTCLRCKNHWDTQIGNYYHASGSFCQSTSTHMSKSFSWSASTTIPSGSYIHD